MSTTVCNVTNEAVRSMQCSEESCSGTGKNRHCHTHYYVCYYPHWLVQFWVPSNSTGNTTNVLVHTAIDGVTHRRFLPSPLFIMKAGLAMHNASWVGTLPVNHTACGMTETIPSTQGNSDPFTLIYLQMDNAQPFPLLRYNDNRMGFSGCCRRNLRSSLSFQQKIGLHCNTIDSMGSL